MAAIDPSYPLYPVACILAAAMLLLVLLTSFIRQSWNLGVAFLCFWLFLESLIAGINGILWSDNAEVKLYVYCDIVSHIQVITSVVKPMATLIITRRLYLITSLRSVEAPQKAVKRRDLAIECILGLIIPLIVAGPFYYVVQEARFLVYEGFGCDNVTDGSILFFLLVKSWNVIPPLVSITVYYPHVARIFYRQNREINHFLQSNDSVSRTNYFRILALASIDVLLTLPIGIATIVLTATTEVSKQGAIPFYRGWTYDHTDWEPISLPYARFVAEGTSAVAEFYFTQWASPVLAFVIFGLFGVTSEARASYWRIVCTVGGWFGWKPTPRRVRSSLGEIRFGARMQQDVSLDLDLESQPSYIDTGERGQELKEAMGDTQAAGGPESCSEKDTTGGVQQPPFNAERALLETQHGDSNRVGALTATRAV